MPQRANSCPSPKSPSADALASDTSAASPPSNSPSNPLPAQRRAQTCPAKCAGQRESEGHNAADRQDPPYMTTTPQGWEADLPDFVFSSSPSLDEWQITETDDGRAVYSTVNGGEGGVIVEFQKWDW